MGRGPFDRAAAWREMAYFAGHWALRGYGHWVLESKHGGELVGRCGPQFPEGWPGLEVGWLLGRRHWGRGYATEAAQAAIDYAFSELRAERVISLIFPGNERSVRVAERLGARRDGTAVVFGHEVDVYAHDPLRWSSRRTGHR